MKRTSFHRLLIALLAVVVFAAACGSDGDEGSAAPDDDAADETPTDDTVGETVTLPEPDRAIEPLSGRDLGDEALLEQPAYAIKIDNDDKARPQNGLSQADIVFELLIENNTSRFLAVFHSTVPPEAGPTRSARSSDVAVLAALNTPVFAYAGSNSGVASEIRAAEADGVLVPINVDSVGGATSYRDSERPAPDNLISVPAEAIAAAGGEPGSPDPILAYRSPDEVGEPGEGGGIELAIGSRNRAVFLWGGGLSGWGRFQNDTPHVDHDGIQLAPANVVVLETEYGTSAADAASPQAQTVGTGKAIVARHGEIVEGTWTRGSPADPFQLVGTDGELILLDPGQTWIGLARPGDYNVLTPEEAVLRALALSSPEA